MTLAHFPQLKKLPKRQRLQLAEELWLSSVDDRSALGASVKKTLDARWDAYSSGKIRRLTLTELERRLVKK